MIKKESYRNNLPHFQSPGQAYFITWSLKDAIPTKALSRYKTQMEFLKSQIFFHEKQKSEISEIEKIKKEYNIVRRKYIQAYDDLLDACKKPMINLMKPENLSFLKEALSFWDGKKLNSYVFCVMPNHVHWVLQLLEKDNKGGLIYLQDILQSVKRYSANRINKLENRSGSLWQKESFETTIRNDKHLRNTIEYTINNPVKAGLVKEWQNWEGTVAKDYDLKLP